MKLSQADLADVQPIDDAPSTKPIKLSREDLAHVQDAEPMMPTDSGSVGLSGPGSRETPTARHPAELQRGETSSGMAPAGAKVNPLFGVKVATPREAELSREKEAANNPHDWITEGIYTGLPAAGVGKGLAALGGAAAPTAGRALGAVGQLAQGAGEGATAAVVGGADTPKDILTGAALGAAARGAPAARVARDAIGDSAIAEGSMARSNKRLETKALEGGTERQRSKLLDVGEEAVEAIRKSPRLKSSVGDHEKFATALKDELAPIEATQKETMARAQMVSGPVQADVIESELRAAQVKAGDAYSKEEVSAAIQEHIDKAADRSKKGKTIDLEDLRAEKSRLQNIAYNRGPNAKPTETQEAAAIAANVIKDTLEKHIDAALPGEGKAFAQRATDESVLLRMKAIADKNVAKPRAATYPWSTAMSVARHPLTAAVRTVRYGFQTADEALAALARAARSGKRPPSEMVDQALAAGVKPESADAIMSRLTDDAVPVSIDEGATVPTPMERMSDIVPRAGMGEDLAAGQAKRASLPDDVAQLDKTQRIRR